MNLGNAPEPVQVGTARWLGASLPWTQHPPPRFLGTNRPRLVGQPQGGWPVHAAPQTPEWAADRQHSGVGCGTQVWESALGLLAREDCVWETCHPPQSPRQRRDQRLSGSRLPAFIIYFTGEEAGAQRVVRAWQVPRDTDPPCRVSSASQRPPPPRPGTEDQLPPVLRARFQVSQ